MDSMITAAARALAVGDLMGALKRVALREDAPALALRGIAMAQLGDFDRAKLLLKRAGRAFGPKEPVARARCVVAEAEIALVSRDLAQSPKLLEQARVTLEAHGDRVNAAHARHLRIRRLLLLGRLEEAERTLTLLDAERLPAALRAAHELVVSQIAIRRISASRARTALGRAELAAARAGTPALLGEVQSISRLLEIPTARLIGEGQEQMLRLQEVETLLASERLIVDACRRMVLSAGRSLSLARRPVLFSLVRALAEAWPQALSRESLIRHAFRAKHADESYRVRLRVEMSRLRAKLKPFARVSATPSGFLMAPRDTRSVVVLAPPLESAHGALMALLADGESWSSTALSLALGASPRTVQRALNALALENQVQSFGRGRARRWTSAPIAGFATTLLLPGPLPSD
jgi:hypothetical protein